MSNLTGPKLRIKTIIRRAAECSQCQALMYCASLEEWLGPDRDVETSRCKTTDTEGQTSN